MEHNISIERTTPHGVTAPLERHPSFPDGMPAIIAEPIPVGYCEVCAWLASEIRKADARGDWSRVADHAWTAIGHVETQHASPGPRLRRELPGLTSSPHRDEAGNENQCTGGAS